jgi:hypothetical protein
VNSPSDGYLPPEPYPELGVRSQFGADDLHRHAPAARRKTQEHPAHPAAAQLP